MKEDKDKKPKKDQQPDDGMSEDEEKEIEKRLEELGYL